MRYLLQLCLISVILTSSASGVWAQSAIPSPDLNEYPEIIPSTTPKPIQSPLPTPVPSVVATPFPVKKGVRLLATFASPQEGQRSLVKLRLENANTLPASAFPLTGEISFDDNGYDQMPLPRRKVAFQIPASGEADVAVLFHSPGRKEVLITLAYPGVADRHFAIYIKPFPVSIFPREIEVSGLKRDPNYWHVWVNLHYSASASEPQRQYYQVTYNDEIIERFLTSSAAPGKITPTGRFKLGPKIASPKSTLYESLMPFWTTILVPNFSFEYGNHGLVGESYLYLLGAPASHGCLRLSNKWVQQGGEWLNIGAAKWVFNHVPVGTTIQIFKKPVQPFAYENYRTWLSKGR
jgi:lipoprotein-anchoring transpeptidase ErfK/SrfK